MLDVYLSGEMSLRSFALVFMGLWGVLAPPVRGRASDALHELFAYLEGCDLDEPVDEALTRNVVATMCADRHNW